MGRKGLILVVAAWAAVGAVAAAQESAVPKELADARNEVRALEQHLRQVTAAQAGLGRQRERLELELQIAAVRVREAEAEQREAAQTVAAAAADAKASQVELEAAMERLRLQISLLAVLGRAGLAPLVVHALGSGQDIPARVTVALALVREEQRRRDEAAALMARREAALSEMSARREALAATAARLDDRRRDLDETRRRVEAQLASLEVERRRDAVALAGAQEAQERMERLWGTVVQQEGGAGPDVRLLRGGLRWPVASTRVLQRFGPHRDPQYGTVTLTHGVVLAAQPGERVVAVAAGKVSYAQFFKGYGNVVIVHHGGDVYSLYGGLASMFVRAGQRVGTGEPLGVAGRNEQGVASVYVEIRVGQSAQDPLTWLKPAGK
ncbi:MAG: peptidoglycan DD-metalloendopeptidase family protein [Thermoanaerobaculaceae bacterium]|nr:peptidoglycan DD-metalloendopeptidase family protein [Thermoanaerobaculaceae bacterium]